MIPAQFDYVAAESATHALDLLAQHGDDARLLSGGHSLLPMMKLRLAQPAHLIDIAEIKDLSKIREEGGKIIIGGAATHHKVETSDLIQQKLGLLWMAARLIGDVQVRNRGTIGGALAHADPAADYPA